MTLFALCDISANSWRIVSVSFIEHLLMNEEIFMTKPISETTGGRRIGMTLAALWILVAGLLTPWFVSSADAQQAELTNTVAAATYPPPRTLSAAQHDRIEGLFTLAPKPGEPITVDHDQSWSLDQTLRRNQMLSVLSTTMGHTDDFAKTAGRVSRLDQMMPTLADTEVIDIEVHNRHVQRGGSWRFENSAALTFVTTTTRADAVSAFTVSFLDAGWDVRERHLVEDGRQITTLYGDPNLGGFGMGVHVTVYDRLEGGSIVMFEVREDHHPDPPPALVGDSWHGLPPAAEFGEPSVFSAIVTSSSDGNHEIDLQTTFADLPDEGEVGEALAVSGSEIVQSFPGGFHLDHQERPALVLIYPPHKDSERSTLKMMQTVAVVAGNAMPPATFVELDVAPAAVVAVPLAEPNGPVITAGMDAKAMAPELQSMLGPADDVGAVAARLGPFPAVVPTLSNASVQTVRGTVSDVDLFGVDDPVSVITDVEYLTTTSIDEAEAAHAAVLTDAGWTLDAISRSGKGDDMLVIMFFELADPSGQERGSQKIGVFLRPEGPNLTVGVDYATRTTRADSQSQIDALAWYGESPLPTGGKVMRVAVDVGVGWQGKTDLLMAVDVRYPGQSLASFTPVALGAFAQHPDWGDLEAESDTEFRGDYPALHDSFSLVELVEETATDRDPDGYVELSVLMSGDLN